MIDPSAMASDIIQSRQQGEIASQQRQQAQQKQDEILKTNSMRDKLTSLYSDPNKTPEQKMTESIPIVTAVDPNVGMQMTAKLAEQKKAKDSAIEDANHAYLDKLTEQAMENKDQSLLDQTISMGKKLLGNSEKYGSLYNAISDLKITENGAKHTLVPAKELTPKEKEAMIAKGFTIHDNGMYSFETDKQGNIIKTPEVSYPKETIAKPTTKVAKNPATGKWEYADVTTGKFTGMEAPAPSTAPETINARATASKMAKGIAGTDKGLDDNGMYALLEYNKAGVKPDLTGFGMGQSAAKEKMRFMNALGAQMKAEGLTPDQIQAKRSGIKAKGSALSELTKQIERVEAFEDTAEKNLGVLEGTINRLPDTGIPIANKIKRAIGLNVLGSTDITKFNTAEQAAINEVARVLNSASASGVISDSARKKVSDILSGKTATKAQIRSAITILKQDMANRKKSYRDQQSHLYDTIATGESMGTSQPAKKTSSAPSKATSQGKSLALSLMD